MTTVGANITRLRKAAGFITQGSFAAALGVPQPRLSDWENDRYGIPDTATLLKIAKALGVSIDDLLAGVDADYDKKRRDLGCQSPGVDSANLTPAWRLTDDSTAFDSSRLVGILAELSTVANMFRTIEKESAAWVETARTWVDQIQTIQAEYAAVGADARRQVAGAGAHRPAATGSDRRHGGQDARARKHGRKRAS